MRLKPATSLDLEPSGCHLPKMLGPKWFDETRRVPLLPHDALGLIPRLY